MKHFRFTTFLTSNADIDESIIDTLVEQCAYREFSKERYALRPGDSCHHLLYIEKGLMRQYTIDEKGKEHIIQFAPENWFITDRDSAFFQQPAQYFIQAVEDTTTILVEQSFLDKLSRESPAFSKFNERLLHNHIRQLQYRIRLLLGADAKTRYLDFVETYPDLLLRIPQSMVASYLGIAPESLSRLRKDLSEYSS